MSWNATSSGSFHQVNEHLRDIKIIGDQRAVEFGHVQIAKDQVLHALDAMKDTRAVFGISFGGHTTSQTEYSTYANVSVVVPPEDGTNQPG